MFRTLAACCAAALVLCMAVPAQKKAPPAAKKTAPAAVPASPAPAAKSALDKSVLEAYVRHLFVFAPGIQVAVGEPQPSATLPGFFDVIVTASNGAASQNFPFYVSKDGKKILQGNVYDVTQNPFQNELAKLKTEFQPSFGTPGAPVVLVEFSDFQCSFCKEEATLL